ncbi:MAG: Mur ligase family protein [Microgenomates group bacterium]
MIVLALFLFVTVLFLGSVRWLRWLGILQQKEYRLDRLLLFLGSGEGFLEIFKVFPKAQELSRTGLKRPKITSRIIVVLVVSGCISVALYFIFWYLILLSSVPVHSYFLPSIAAGIVTILLPVIVLASALPTAFISQILTTLYLQRASALLKKSSPIIIGITGSYGKTSTRQLLTHCIGKCQSVFSPPHSYNTKLGIANSILAGYHGQSLVLLEFGAYAPGEIKALTKYFPPQMVMLTGFSPQHVGLFGSEEGIAKAKAELVQSLPENAMVFYNADDAGVQRIFDAANRSDVQKIPYEKTHKGEWQFPHLTEQATAEFEWKGEKITTRIVGLHYLSNLSGAVTVASLFHCVGEKIIESIREYKPSEHIIKIYTTTNDVTILDDGDTANPQGFSAVLDVLAALPQKPKVLITPGIIDLSTSTNRIHTPLAEKSESIVDTVLYVGEPGQSVFKKLLGERCVTAVSEVQNAIRNLKGGSVLCIEGKLPQWAMKEIAKLG